MSLATTITLLGLLVGPGGAAPDSATLTVPSPSEAPPPALVATVPLVDQGFLGPFDDETGGGGGLLGLVGRLVSLLLDDEDEEPTPTPPPTETETPSPTPTETETPSPTPTETETPSPTPTETETPSPTPTETETPSPTPTETETPSPTPTETETPAPTASGTPPPTPTGTATSAPPLTGGVDNGPTGTGLSAGSWPPIGLGVPFVATPVPTPIVTNGRGPVITVTPEAALSNNRAPAPFVAAPPRPTASTSSGQASASRGPAAASNAAGTSAPPAPEAATEATDRVSDEVPARVQVQRTPFGLRDSGPMVSQPDDVTGAELAATRTTEGGGLPPLVVAALALVGGAVLFSLAARAAID